MNKICQTPGEQQQSYIVKGKQGVCVHYLECGQWQDTKGYCF